MNDYNVTIKVRNNRIIRAIRESGGTLGAKWCNENGLNYGRTNDLINLTASPILDDGSLSVHAERLCFVLGVLPEELWSAEQVRPLERNWSQLELSQSQVTALIDSHCDDGSGLLEAVHDEDMKRLIDEQLSTIPPRMRRVLELRFYHDMTLEEAGNVLGVTPARARQIEQRAFRLLRNPKRSDSLKPLLGIPVYSFGQSQ